jgi:hypothetical protein
MPESTLRPVLGIVRAVDGATVTAELFTGTGGSGVNVACPAVWHAPYAPGDLVLALFQGEEPDSAVIVGRVGDAAAACDPAAFLRRDGTTPLAADWDAGAGRRLLAGEVRARDGSGLRLADDAGALGLCVEDGGQVGVGTAAPAARLDVQDAALTVALRNTQADRTVALAFYDNVSALKGRLLYAGGNPAGAKYFGFINEGGDYLGFFSDLFRLWNKAASATHLLVDAAGNVGLGTASPQGRLHTWDGVSGSLTVSKGSIGATAQTILPNGAGDVTKLARVEGIASNGTAHAAFSGTLAVGGALSASAGGDTYELRVNADGSMDVRRTAGSNPGTVMLRVLWM